MIILIIILSIILCLMQLILNGTILLKYNNTSWYNMVYFISELIITLTKIIMIILSLGLACFFINKIFDYE